MLLMNLFISNAQIKPDAVVAVPNPTGTGTPYKPADYTASSLINYIRTWEMRVPTTDETYVTSASRTVDQVNIATQYLDGLGRPLETVNWQASPGKQDIVTLMSYDGLGREPFKFLPYTSPTASAAGKQGQFKVNPFTEQSNFYTNTYKGEQPAFNNEKYFYSKTNFEPSPLNRTDKMFAPGNSWAGSEGGAAEKKTSLKYLVNTSANDAVRIWRIGFNATVADNTNLPYSNSGDIYGNGQLYKMVTTDEAGNATIEYKDKEGQVVLKKVQTGTVPADFSGYTNFLCTFYVYDDLNQLRTVIQPKAVAAMLTAGNWTLSQTMVNELCFRYEYDYRKRMIAKKVPGAGWVYMVYDIRDRLVFTQDANMRSKAPQQWMYTLYDDLNRPVQTGIMAYTGTWAMLISSMPTTSINAPITNTGTNQNVTLADMYINMRETGRVLYESTNSIVFDDGFSSETNADFTAQIVTEAASTFSDAATVNTYPIPVSGTTLYPLTYTYYDGYTATSKAYNTTNRLKLDDGGNTNADILPSQSSTLIKGMVTVTKVRVIEDANNLALGKWLETASFYDDEGRLIQTQNTNYKGGNDIVTTRYDFTNKMVSSYTSHNNASGNATSFAILSSLNYDHAGRLETITKKVKDDDANKRIIVSNTYDILGQVKNKKTGQKSVSDATALEDDNYHYNIRGWLKGINYYSGTGTYASQMSRTSDKWFSMDLSYDWGFGSASQHNGNIAGTRWKTAGDGQERAYGFSYDAANRLLAGDFTQNSSGWATDAIFDFSMKMGNGTTASTAYDENGNILKMWQKGMTGLTNSVIDNLTYSYFPSSNRLSAVAEVTPADNKTGDFTDNNTSGNDYGYDVNGNMITDLNKRLNGTTGIDLTTGGAIVYNFLNLPWQINVKNADGSAKGTISYIYDATGNKLEKRTTEGTTGQPVKQTVTTYLGAFVYENNVLQFLSHEEGRIRYKVTDNTYPYDYFIKDHLGNVRMVLTDGNQQAQVYQATVEPQNRATELALFGNELASTEKDKSLVPGFDTDASNTRVTYLRNDGNANTQNIGPGVLLKVMAGDKVKISAQGWYRNQDHAAGNNSVTSNVLTQIANLLTNTIPATGGKFNSSQIQNGGSNVINQNVPTFFSDKQVTDNSRPKAYMNWVLLSDAQLAYISGGSGAMQIPTIAAGAQKQVMQAAGGSYISMPQNGYLYVYLSNESSTAVSFDDFRVDYQQGPLLEETHYYPFGLTMSGISSKAAGGLDNRYKFNSGTELNSDFDLSLYETNFRSYDPQIGRFWQIDPLGFLTSEVSGYAFALNNPILRNDPTGLADTIRGKLAEVTVVTHPQKLQGGSFNGKSFSQVKEFNQLYASLSKRKITDPIAAGKYLKDQVQGAKSVEEKLKLIGEVGGGTAPVAAKEIIELIKTLKAGTLKFSAVTALAAQIYVEGIKAGMLTEDLQKISESYIELHSNSTTSDASAAKGIYQIITVFSVQNSGFGLSNQITTTSYYDISTNKFLGDATSR